MFESVNIEAPTSNKLLPILESSVQELALTVEQVEALRELGRELRGRGDFYRQRQQPEVELAEDSDDEDDDVAELKRSVIRCQSAGGGKYRVFVRNAIGVIALPGVTLYIEPKIPINHFAHLAKLAYVSPRLAPDAVAVDNLDAFWELIARWAITEIEHLIRYGLLSDYESITDDLGAVRGRVNARETTYNFLGGRLEANCSFDELDLDHPLNRVLRAAARMIAGSPLIKDEELAKRASRLDRAMDGIGALRHTDLYTVLDRRTHRYADAFDLSSRVLGLVGTNVAVGERAGRTFLIPTPGLVEDAIRAIFASSLPGVVVSEQGKRLKGDRFFTINPDIVINNGNVTGDVKYKIAKDEWNRAEVQQAALFATGYQASAAFIATFARGPDVRDLSMQIGDLFLKRIVWNAADDVDPVDSEQDFIKRIRAFVGGYLEIGQAA
jgi:hypothetical protein